MTQSFKLTFSIFSLLFTTSCATLTPSENPKSRDISIESPPALSELETKIQEANSRLEGSTDRSFSGQSKQTHSLQKIPLETNENVMKWIHYFTQVDRDRFNRFLKRGNTYKSVVQEILRKNEIPSELYYLAMIESGYNTQAQSPAGAVGIWQFIRGTGHRYGLEQNSYIDERRDVIRSTEAAAKYLRNLYIAFQSWYLAIAGYNAGEGRILGAIMNGGSRNFWDLVENKSLPPETRNYVPKFLAAILIGQQPEKYGFTDIESTEFPAVRSIEVPGGLNLSTISEITNISYNDLKILNPHLLKNFTPKNVQKYALWVPLETFKNSDQLTKTLALLKPSRDHITSFKKPKASTSGHFGHSDHSVPQDDTLHRIAQRFASSSSRLKRTSRLRSGTLLAGQKTRSTLIHKVRSGDALIEIASRYSVSVSKIKRLNDLRTNHIYVGQRLIISKSARKV